MRIFLAVLSGRTWNWQSPEGEIADGQAQFRCQNMKLRRTAIQETWLQNSPVDYRFVFGRTTDILSPDEISLDCDDGYYYLQQKVQAVMRHAYNLGYDFVIRCDDDTYIDLPQLLKTDFAKHDYSGYKMSGSPGAGFAHGGCYVVSRKAMRVIFETVPRLDEYEDQWVGQELAKRAIRLHHMPEFKIVKFELTPADYGLVALHSCSPEMMREIYALDKPTAS
jgi:hypothetical protein